MTKDKIAVARQRRYDLMDELARVTKSLNAKIAKAKRDLERAEKDYAEAEALAWSKDHTRFYVGVRLMDRYLPDNLDLPGYKRGHLMSHADNLVVVTSEGGARQNNDRTAVWYDFDCLVVRASSSTEYGTSFSLSTGVIPLQSLIHEGLLNVTAADWQTVYQKLMGEATLPLLEAIRSVPEFRDGLPSSIRLLEG